MSCNKIRPSEVVDQVIKIVVDIVTPGGGAGSNTWWMRGLRNAQRGAQRIEKEMEIRAHLAEWDESYPMIHHELIIRYAAGLLASSAAVAVYGIFRGDGKRRRYDY